MVVACWRASGSSRTLFFPARPLQGGAMSTPEPTFQIPTLEAWTRAAAESAPGGDLNALNWVTPDGITVKPLYTGADLQGLKYADTLPGFEPYLRGPQ